MKITLDLFAAHLKCPTKCWLRSRREAGEGNEYAEWVYTQNESYRRENAKRLLESVPETECVIAPPAGENPKTTGWRLAMDLPAQTPDLESCLHAVERASAEGRGKSAQFIPIRFVFTNKLTRDDRLLVAFDTLVLSEVLEREVTLGKIIHGDDQATLRVKTATLFKEVRKRIEKIAALLSSQSPPDLVLNRHCAECEFQARCRQKAIEKDDLSLLAGMSEKARKKFNSKGIFTVTQLSYTFRPRRRPKRLRDKREKYHHSLKALAIRERKIHIVGTPELKIEGTPVYLDVEGLPDREFYYLIGVRMGNGETAVQRSLWADTIEDEGDIWRDFLAILETIEKPVLIHYSSYETTFLKRMGERHGKPSEGSTAFKAIQSPVNILSTIFAHVYFPTYSNGLKAVAIWLGFTWQDSSITGTTSITRRSLWELSHDPAIKRDLAMYNAGDCEALQHTTVTICCFGRPDSTVIEGNPATDSVVNVDSLETRPTMWPRFSSSVPDFNQINKAARWDYQRDRVYIRTDERIKKKTRRRLRNAPRSSSVNKTSAYSSSTLCPHCVRRGAVQRYASKVLYDLHFGRWSLKRWVVRYEYCIYHCLTCHSTFGTPDAFWPGSKYGRNLVRYVVYNLIELCIPQRVVTQSVNRLFGYNLADRVVHGFKAKSATTYAETKEMILQRMLAGPVILADETHIGIKGRRTYVWVFTKLHEVVYAHSETREGVMVQKVLARYRGVLVSDFYAPYDSVNCPQQKCLLHLTRDLNDELLAQPYDEELRVLVNGFAGLLRPIIETVEHYGLKKYFLKKHVVFVDRFFRVLLKTHFTSEAALKCKARCEKNREMLFTFLEYDGVPWNNNNAEHAIKAFARLRRVIEGLSTLKGIEEYLVLLSICQTCKYQGLDFLDFLRSGEKDIEKFAESSGKKRKQPALSRPSTESIEGNAATTIPPTF